MTLFRYAVLMASLGSPALVLAQPAPSPWTGSDSPPPRLPPPPPSGLALTAPSAFEAPSDAARLARLTSALTWQHDLDRSRRTAVTVASSILGGVLLGTGVILSLRSGSTERPYGLGLSAVGGGLLIGVAISAFLPGGWDPMINALREGRERRDPPRSVIVSAETVWREHAERNRRARRIAGVILSVVGGLGLVSGTVFLLVEPERRSTREIYRVGGTGLAALGIGMGIGGASLLFSPDSIEQGWEMYHRSTGGGLSVGVGPVAGGAVAGVGGNF